VQRQKEGQLSAWWILGGTVLLAAGWFLFKVYSPPPESPNRWTSFAKVAGHTNEIPDVWLQTEAGKQAHALGLPDGLPKPVPFNFSQARWRALNPLADYDSVSRQYWKHLCDTEAGQFIFRTVEGVDGLAYMRRSPVKDESAADEDPWLYEAPAVEITEAGKSTIYIADRYIDAPWATYARVEMPDLLGQRWERLSMTDRGPLAIKESRRESVWDFEQIDEPTERFALTWRGVHRVRDREHRIAGSEIIVFDRKSGEVLALVRDFAQGAETHKFKYRVAWRNLRKCPQVTRWLSHDQDSNLQDFPARILKPRVEPLSLKLTDQKISERAAKRP
jgi:hypothetical protein